MRILVLQHLACEHPGSFREVMAAGGHAMVAVELDEGEAIPAAEHFDILLVMGGPMDVWQESAHPWLNAEKIFIRDWVRAGKPYLGLCLGAQLLAAAMGGEVAAMTGPPEVGISTVDLVPDKLFAGVPDACTCFQWHAAEVTMLPPGAKLLASSPGCAVQAFSLGSCAYGLQFHLELTETTATEWGDVPDYVAALEAVHGPGALPVLEADVARHFTALQDAAKTIFSNFLELAQRAPAPAII